ncbi:hypothetical protein T10_9555 [Trichinella papuae]|uniref:Integrase catalytic domain-containing protein n=1 Tax=Trichinella papuae TaxID=268474 RepID=A0A0V1MEQ6_9BILA|nr:hypothetical protein T10_9555 [Trichinella papuae]
MASAAKSRSKKLVALKDRLNRLLAELDELCIGSADVFEVEEQVSLMEETFRAADELQTEVELDLEGEERQATIDDWALCRQNYRVGKSRAHARMVEARGEGPIGGGNVSAGRPAVRASNGRLPEVTLPKFAGHRRDGAERHRRNPSQSRKLHPGGRHSEEAFWSAETGDTRASGGPVEAPACREMTARGIQSLVDEVTKHLRCLTALDRDPFSGRFPLSEGLMPMLQDKFPPALIRAWDTNIRPDATEDEDNLQKFLEFAQWQAGLLSKSKREDTKPSASKSEQRTPSSKPSRPEWKYGDRIRSTAAALAVVAAKSCPFCSGEHKAEECEKFLQADLSRRRDMVRAKEVCFRCLRTGHQAKGCREGRHCGVDGCRQQHHKLLHPSSTTESAQSPRSDRARQGLLAARGAPGGCLQTVRTGRLGPNLQIDLLRAILSFRRLRVGLQADIEKMYLQIRVRAEDRDACRFLWWDDEQKIRKYRLTRICFGLTCSPFLAMGTVRSHARQHQESAPRAAEEVLNNMYMDDLATSCDSVAEARGLVDQLGSLLASGGFQLHKWASNEPNALRDLPVEKTTMGTGDRPWKTLGIYWERNDDYLTFVAPERRRPEGRDTKRKLLSTASGIFDPIGCLAPFLVRAKILFQSLWEKGLDWDEPLPEDVERPWSAWKRELGDLSLIRLPRALVPVPLDQAKRIELHAFCDASERAYGTVVYLRVETSFGSARVSLAAAKTRVAPVKRLSLPRLELMGALTAARLIRYVQGALRLDIRSLSCWSDSEVTLAWIRSAASQWKPFVRNRVEEIQQLVEPTCWRHCPGKSNPADVLSRGASLKGLAKKSCWWQGPRWLAGPTETWPQKRGPSKRNSMAPPDEDRSLQTALLVSVVTHATGDVLDPGRYGDIEKLFRITALCLRFVHNCGSTSEDRRTGPLTAPELEAAEQVWVRIAQRQGFQKEIEALKTNGNVAARSNLCPLNPYLDAAGTLRVGGRLGKSNIPLSEKHPALLPGEHEVTRGLILRYHLRQLHAGVSQTLSTLRQRYWIPRGRSRVRQVIRGCLQCRWATGRPPQPKMADLPEARTNPAPAFAHVGMDFAGPPFVRATRKTTAPRYVCLVTCMVSRAVHLELVPEMSTTGVLQALRRFMARRGRPAIIQTDNFRSFQSAASELRRLWQGIDVDQVQRDLAGQRIRWKFILPRAPWMGGYWERLIRTTKEIAVD